MEGYVHLSQYSSPTMVREGWKQKAIEYFVSGTSLLATTTTTHLMVSGSRWTTVLSSQGGIFHVLPIPSMSPHRLDNQLSFHYCLIFLQTTSVMFVSVDTVSIDDNKNDAESIKQLLESELAKAGDDEWKIVFGHYPCHSGGGYSGYRSMREQILPTMKAHNVDFYLTGHDHNLQHWRKKDNPADVDHIITGKASFNPACLQTSFPGAGGKNSYGRDEDHVDQNEAMGMELENFSEQNGFSYFSVSTTEITVKFVAADGATIYQYTRSKRKSFQACFC